MTPAKDPIRQKVSELLVKFDTLPDSKLEAEKRTEEFITPLFETLGWDLLTSQVTPQSRVRSASRTTRPDYSFRKEGDLRHSFLLEVKRFSSELDNPDYVKQRVT
ncbi:hypothetical protein HY095_02575 [Candidatus Micrarchaeota archaeon]|nr:hypothetical protein [Candidatus Micrarchaeota archaeon]